MKKPKSRDVLVFLIFFVFVFFYWYLVNMGEEHEAKFTFDVVLRHMPEDAIITEMPDAKVSSVVRDRGERILGYRTRRTFRQLPVDCRNYKAADGHVVITGAALDELLAGALSSTAHIQSVTPDTLQFYIAPSTGRRLPVRLAGHVSADNSHVIGSQRLVPDSVTVHAPAAVLDTLTCVLTEPVSFDGLSDSLSAQLSFVAPHGGMLFKPSTTTLCVQVTPYVQKSFELPIRDYLFPYKSVLRAFPSKATVTFQVSLERFYDVTEEQFELVVNYVNLDPNDDGKARLELVRRPDDIRSITISPSEVDYLIEYNDDL